MHFNKIAMSWGGVFKGKSAWGLQMSVREDPLLKPTLEGSPASSCFSSTLGIHHTTSFTLYPHDLCPLLPPLLLESCLQLGSPLVAYKPIDIHVFKSGDFTKCPGFWRL